MLNDQVVRHILVLADDMIAAGVEELKTYDPKTESAQDAVARIYMAMEVILLEIKMQMELAAEAPDRSKMN
jgi:hypothetical protein